MGTGERIGAGAGVGTIFGGIGAAIAAARRPGVHREIVYKPM
jgi:hypothetical protein